MLHQSGVEVIVKHCRAYLCYWAWMTCYPEFLPTCWSCKEIFRPWEWILVHFCGRVFCNGGPIHVDLLKPVPSQEHGTRAVHYVESEDFGLTTVVIFDIKTSLDITYLLVSICSHLNISSLRSDLGGGEKVLFGFLWNGRHIAILCNSTKLNTVFNNIIRSELTVVVDCVIDEEERKEHSSSGVSFHRQVLPIDKYSNKVWFDKGARIVCISRSTWFFWSSSIEMYLVRLLLSCFRWSLAEVFH